MSTSKPRIAALAGIAAVWFGLGLAHLVAAIVGPAASPVVSIANRVVDMTPTPVKEWAVTSFGTADKVVLVVGIVVVTSALGAVVGLLGGRRLWWGVVGGGVLAGTALVAAGFEPVRVPLWWLPALVAFGAGSVALRMMIGRLPAASPNADERQARRDGADRRTVLKMAAWLGGGGVAAGALGQALVRTPVVGVTGGAPVPSVPSPSGTPLPAGLASEVPGLSPFVTPIKDFYRIDTAFTVPRLDAASWRLSIDGMVDTPFSIGWDELIAMDAVARDVTLECVSNEVAGGLIGSARWVGVRTSEILARAGASADADMVLSTSADGFTVSTPLQALTDERDALLCYAMNGEPLTPEHGFPVRLITPGLYGFVGATKWVTQLTVTRYDKAQAYWTQRGWAAKAPMKPGSRIETPRAGDHIPAGTVKIGGAAWVPRVGVGRVQVRVDGGEWMDAKLGPDAGIDYWRQWVFLWNAPAGEHELQVRVVDPSGLPQTETSTLPFPDGAAGIHTVRVTITS